MAIDLLLLIDYNTNPQLKALQYPFASGNAFDDSI